MYYAMLHITIWNTPLKGPNKHNWQMALWLGNRAYFDRFWCLRPLINQDPLVCLKRYYFLYKMAFVT